MQQYVKLSSQAAIASKIGLDTMFVLEYMPTAPEQCVKIYLFGLALATVGDGADNSVQKIARRLGVTESIVTDAFDFWAELGLVRLLETSPPSVEYLPVKAQVPATKKYNKDKYRGFCDQLQAMLGDTMISINEFHNYFMLIEELHLQKEAVLCIVSYAIRRLGLEEFRHNYVFATARNLAHDGLLTYDAVHERLNEFCQFEKQIREVLRALKLRRNPDHESDKLYRRWTRTFGFEHQTILAVAKKLKGGGVERLDTQLTKYAQMGIISQPEIDEYHAHRDRMMTLAREVTRIIGVYYEQLDYIIEKYINAWLGQGFDSASIVKVAEFCFQQSRRTLESMNDVMQKFYRQGLLTTAAIDNYVGQTLQNDRQISELLDKMGISRTVTTRDREFFRTWTTTWLFGQDMLDHAAGLAHGKSSPMSYMNSVLANWLERGVRTLAAAQATQPPGAASPASAPPSPVAIQNSVPNRVMSAAELNALFDNLDAEDM